MSRKKSYFQKEEMSGIDDPISVLFRKRIYRHDEQMLGVLAIAASESHFEKRGVFCLHPPFFPQRLNPLNL
jgi:hypothetical protein